MVALWCYRTGIVKFLFTSGEVSSAVSPAWLSVHTDTVGHVWGQKPGGDGNLWHLATPTGWRSTWCSRMTNSVFLHMLYYVLLVGAPPPSGMLRKTKII